MLYWSARLSRRRALGLLSLFAVFVTVLGACGSAATPAALPTTAAQPAAVATRPPAAASVAPAVPAAAATAAPTAEATDAPAATSTAEATAEATAGGGAQSVSFAGDVMPIFEARCIKCHGGERTRGGLDMKTYDALMKGGEEGEAINPGNAAGSMLVELIVEGKMPRREDPLTAEQIAIISRWVDQGAQNN
jgi:mono/diheme cytochrome c family protein